MPSEVVPGLPPAFDDVVRRALAKRPEDRFPSGGRARPGRSRRALRRRPADRAGRAGGRRGGSRRGIRESEMLPLVAAAGDPGAAEGIRASGACAVLVGRGGLGDWAREGLAAARGIAARDRAFRLVLVLLLPGGPDPGTRASRTSPGTPGSICAPEPPTRTRWADLVRAVRGADVLPGTAPPADGVPPYRGLEAFREEDASLYFGREQDIARILERLRSTRFVAVLGASGSGKSSLVQAGLLPALRRESPGATPGSSRSCPAPTRSPPWPPSSPTCRGAGSPSPADLAADERALDLAVARALEGRPPDERVLIVRGPARGGLHALLRRGRAGRVPRQPRLRGDDPRRAHRRRHHDARRLLPPPRGAPRPARAGRDDTRSCSARSTRAACRRAIEEPARHCGLELEPGLTRRILTDVADRPGTLPAPRAPAPRALAPPARPHPDARGLRARPAGSRAPSPAGPTRSTARCRPSARRSPAASSCASPSPARAPRTPAAAPSAASSSPDPAEKPEVDAVVDALAEARLVTTGTDEATGEPVVEVTHEALIRGWPELRGWIDEDRDRLRAERRLSDAAAGVGPRRPRRRRPLPRERGSRPGRSATPSDLTPLERDYLEASTARAERDRQARRERVRIAIGGPLGRRSP